MTNHQVAAWLARHVGPTLVNHPDRVPKALAAVIYVLVIVVGWNRPWAVVAATLLVGTVITREQIVDLTRRMSEGIEEASRVEDLHPDLVRLDLADFIRNYQPKEGE